MSCKRAMARNKFGRASRNSSPAEAERRSHPKIGQLLRTNVYPETEIATAGRAKRKRHKKIQSEKPTSILKLPFINCGLSWVVKRIVINLCGPWLSSTLAGAIFVRSCSVTDDCPVRNSTFLKRTTVVFSRRLPF